MADNQHGDRALGQFPLSIATSLAIESACNINPDVRHRQIPIRQVDELWVNVRTLFRNFMGSLSKNSLASVLPMEIAQQLYNETHSIVQAIDEYSNKKAKVVFYVSNYNGIDRYKVGVPRVDNTLNQKLYTGQMKESIALLMKEQKDFEIKVFDLKLKDKDKFPKALILTHYAFDLLSEKSFADLTLLESHTGAVKGKDLWYTKYVNGKNYPNIPFREDFIQIFGDNETFRPADPKLKEEIEKLAKEFKWTALTSTDRIRFSVNTMRNHYARDLVKSIIV